MASIRERESKTGELTWAVLYRHGGKQRSTTMGSLPEATKFKALLDALGPDKALAAVNDAAPDDRMTVSQLAELYLTWKSRDVTPRTMADYRRDIDNWVLPFLGHRAAESLDESDVQTWVDHMAQSLSPKSVAGRHMLLHSIYDYGKARSRKLVSHNPCLESDLPKRSRKPPKGTTVPQFRLLLDAAAERNPDARDLILYIGSVGWRFSEATALLVDMVERRANGVVWVDMTRVFRMLEHRQVLMADTAKSYAGFRRVPVPNDEAADMLMRRTIGKGPNDYVFTSSRGTFWNQNTFLRGTWRSIVTDAGLWVGPKKSPTPHWLRHMAVAVLAAAGASPEQIQRYIGHEDLSTTMGTYGGLLGGLTNDVIRNASNILGGEVPEGLVVAGDVVTVQQSEGLPALNR